MTGMIQGGWEYVVLAYGLTVTVLVVYGVSMELRLKKEKKR
ncbi:MAG: hypothetical protein ACK4YP_15685 [Myxococcota bacterium]